MMNRNKHLTKLMTALLIGMMTIAVAVADSALTQPKADGLIGEQANGYIGLVREDAPANIRRLVDEVNAKRKAGYQEIATKQGARLEDVERVGGNTAIEKTLEGNYVKDASGVWRKK